MWFRVCPLLYERVSASDKWGIAPSALCILLFLVTVWWAKGLELQRLCSLFLHFSTSLNRFAFQTAGHPWVIIHLFRWKWSLSMWRGGCCSRFIQTLPSWELQIYYWKCIYYYCHDITEALWIGQPISSLKIMKLFGKDGGCQNAGQGTPSGPWQGSRGSRVILDFIKYVQFFVWFRSSWATS